MNGSGRGKARRGIGKVIRTVTRLRQNFKSGRMTAKRKGEKVTLLSKTLDGEQKSCYNKSRGKRRLYGELSEWSKVQHSKWLTFVSALSTRKSPFYGAFAQFEN